MPSEPPEIVGSPFKRHRASIQDIGGSILAPIGSHSTNDFFPPSSLAAGHSSNGTPPVSATASQAQTPSASQSQPAPDVKLEAKMDSDEEL
jgi:hypothetical protein